MGDGGKLYSSYNEELCLKMRQLLNVADVLTPNLTEVCQLLDIEYPDKMPTEAELLKMAQAIATKGVKQIVITGLVNETADKVYNYIYEQGKIHVCKRIIAYQKNIQVQEMLLWLS